MSNYNIESLAVYIPMDRRQAMQDGTAIDGEIVGTALFADISGFTPLSEALARSLGPQRGAEELTIHLNRFYDALIDQLHIYRGSVIGFSGDAITCWFDQDLGHRAAACALAMQRTTAQFQNIKLPDEDTTTLAMKAALVYGQSKRILVGDPDTHIKDVIIGRLMDNLAAAENAAGSGEIILDQSVIENIKDEVTLTDQKVPAHNGRVYGILEGFHQEAGSLSWPEINPKSLAVESVKPWLLEPVYRRLQRGQGEFLAELRPAVALFARFSGIDYEGDPQAGNKLDEFIRRVQFILLQYDSSLIQLTTGDKGSYLNAAFGAPNAHEDDSIRAVSAAYEIRDILSELEYISSIQIGISQGTMRTGAYGGTQRRTYGVLGDETNLAARLMTAAGDGQILVSQRVKEASGNQFFFEPQTPIKVKGKSSYINLFSLKDRRTAQSNIIQTYNQDSPIFGRTEELALAKDKIELTLNSRGQILGIEGEAGIGKSRLAAEIIRGAEEHGMHGYAGQCQSYGTNTSYLVWRDIWGSFFDVDPNLSLRSNIKKIEEQLEAYSTGLSARLPLLSPLLNIRIPDNSLTENFDAKLRKSSLESLLVDCLRGRAKRSPLYIVLEDCHWLDPLSHDLLEVIGRAIFDLPVLLIVDFRPSDVSKGDQIRVNKLTQFSKFSLSTFSAQEAGQFIRFRLGEYLDLDGQAPPSVVENIAQRSEGNPFYIEELVNYLKDRGVNPNDESALLNLELPTSLHSLVLTRIDERTEHQKATIKVASVIGRTFAAEWVWSAFSQANDEMQVRSDLDELSSLDLTPLDTPEPDLTYIFKHAITHEAAYESLPFASRSDLHGQLGAFIESCCLDQIDQNIDLLAYHYEKSANESKKRQDRYGSSFDISIKSNQFPVPDLAVGRLVETPLDVTNMLDAYLNTSGGILPAPSSSLVTGYDFLEDAALAVQSELSAGIGAVPDSLISPRNISPQDPAAWNADQLREILFASRHDLIFLAGHFSASSALAADYQTRLLSTEVLDSLVDLENVLVYSAGCHSGYNIVDAHGVPGVTRQPDWAQTFAKKGATLIAGTGYQYGDTDFIAYSEKLYLEFTRQLRSGSGPVPIGKALVEAKKDYLESTSQMKGIHEKALLEATLFGLPMLSVNMPGARLNSPSLDANIPASTNASAISPSAFGTDPGLALGLEYADLSVVPSLTQHQVELTNPADGLKSTATYLSGSDGIITNPAEPVLPLEIRDVGVAGTVARGVGFRGGAYSDLLDILPLTGAATTEIRGVHTPILSSVFFPVVPWRLNYFNALTAGANGSTDLFFTPAQFQSNPDNPALGTMRKYTRGDFRIYYSSNFDTFQDNSIPALAAPPDISKINAIPGSDEITFNVRVLGNPAAGIQEVWLVYTAINGPLAGIWQPLDLIQNSQDSTLWQGTLPLNGVSAGEIRYMVQAVNGVGLVSISTNLGVSYIPGLDNADKEPTEFSLEAPINTSAYGSLVTFSAVLTSNSTPLSGKIIQFGLGALRKLGVTDTSGRAAVTIPLLGLAGNQNVKATFAGSLEYFGSTATNPFLITKAQTRLTLDPESNSGLPDKEGLASAILTDNEGRRLSEKSVFFVITGQGRTCVEPVITDYTGRATIGKLPYPYPPGVYTVEVYFSGDVPLPGYPISLSDDRFEPASTSGTITIEYPYNLTFFPFVYVP